MVMPFTTALGDSPAVTLAAASTVDIAPGDVFDPDNTFPEDVGVIGSGTNSVNANRVIITGSGDITSFGQANGGQVDEDGNPATITKQVTFEPDAGKTIILHHDPVALSLLGGVNRTISVKSFGEYQSDALGNWTETRFSGSDQQPTQHGGQLIGVNYYTASATITIPPGATRAWVRMWGGSGGTSGGDFSSGTYSGGTGAGGYLEKFLTGLTPGNTFVFTRGNHGNGAVLTPSAIAATAGTASTLASGTQTISTLTANGSPAGPTLGGGGIGAGGIGGTATGGDINLTGQHGGAGQNAQPGIGGSTMLAKGALGSVASDGTGNPGYDGGLVITWSNDPKF
jgi:hypothetical protein